MNKKINSSETNVYVTQPYLPPLEEFIPYLEGIWERKILTNNGPLHEDLEAALCEYLGVEHISLFTNGTIALITALQALKIKGEVITTPYTFAATAHSLLWNDITPVFVDIDPITCNIDPRKIEEAITPNTTAIMPVHCYGVPCDVEAIQRIAPLTTKKQVRSFIGLINYYQDMWPRRSETLAPLTHLTSKYVPFQWTDVKQQAFDKIKSIVCCEVLLLYPDFNKLFYIICKYFFIVN